MLLIAWTVTLVFESLARTRQTERHVDGTERHTYECNGGCEKGLTGAGGGQDTETPRQTLHQADRGTQTTQGAGEVK